MATTLQILLLLSATAAILGPVNGRSIIPLPESPTAAGETLTKLHFYIHDFVHGENQSVYDVAESSITSHSSSYFGRVQVVDHLITAGRELDSEKVGRVQGMHVMSDLHEPAIGVNWNFVFNDGSTITVLGRLVAFDEEGELAIVGGTGKYLMARGIAFKRCLVMDPDTWNSIMEYTMYVYSSDPIEMLRGF